MQNNFVPTIEDIGDLYRARPMFHQGQRAVHAPFPPNLATFATTHVTPAQFGANATIGADAAVALQAAINKVRNSFNATAGDYEYVLDLGGRMWETSVSLDLTQIRSPGFTMQNGGIYGTCTGKAILDCAGLNSGRFINVHLFGDKTSTPGIGFMLSKADNGAGGFPDAKQNTLINCSTNGYFSKTAYLNFASEVSDLIGCEFLNKSRSLTAYDMIMCANAATLDNYVGGVTSDYVTIPTAASGNQSCIIHNWGQVRASRTADVNFTPTSVSATNPVVITYTLLAGLNLANDAHLYIYNFAGGTWNTLNRSVYRVKNIGATTFELYAEDGVTPVDGAALGTWTGGQIQNRTGPGILLSGCQALSINGGYALTYGNDALVFDMENGPTTLSSNHLHFDAEHQPPSAIRFDRTSAGVVACQDFHLDLPSINQTYGRAVLRGNMGAGSVRFDGGAVTVASMPASPTNGLFENPGQFNIRGMKFQIPLAAAMNSPSAFINFSGEVYTANNDAHSFNTTGTNTVVADFICTEDGAVAGPLVDIERVSASPAANDAIGILRFVGRDSAGNAQEYAGIAATIIDPTGALEDARLSFRQSIAGTVAVSHYLQGGVMTFNTTLTVASLPAGSPVGSIAYASNLRVFNGAGTQEGAGAGTGGFAHKTSLGWVVAGTNITAQA